MKKIGSLRRSHTFAVGAVAALAFFLFLIRSDTAIEYMKKGLKLCATTVIPSLFPFMVISELLVSCGFGRLMGRVLSRPVKWLFGVSESCACAFVLGTVCGFPIGARMLCAMYDRGELTKAETERALTFCNNPGSAFVISAVGLSLFGNRNEGIMLYVCVILSAIIVGVVGRLIFGKSDEAEKKDALLASRDDIEGVEIFTRAIGSSAVSMLTVCAYVAFFSSFVGCIGSLLQRVGASNALTATIFAFFEISSGVGMASELQTPVHALLMCAAALGWSGLSVHLQIATICSGRNISLTPYFIAKAAQGVICLVLVGVLLRLFPFSDNVYQSFYDSSTATGYSNANYLCLAFFVAALLPVVIIEVRRTYMNFAKRQMNWHSP